MVRHHRFRHMLQRLLEARELQRQRPFLRSLDARNVGQRVHIDAPLCEQAVDAGVGVLQVRRGVAVEGEHRVPIEHVVAGAVLRQIGVLHRADAHRMGDPRCFFPAEPGILRFHQGARARRCLLQQVEQSGSAA